MSSELLREYYVALGYVQALLGCLEHLDRRGADPAFTETLRAQVRGLGARLEQALADSQDQRIDSTAV